MVKIIYSIFSILALSTVAFGADGFILDSIEEANKLSKATNKPMLIIFGADYCKFCSLLKEDILNHEFSPAVDQYIICYIDIKNNPDVKHKYGVSTIPDSRIFTDTKEINRIRGYSKDTYKKWLLNNDRQ
jgi:thioredoxin-related protein